jgi:signal transduction histidine kinase
VFKVIWPHVAKYRINVEIGVIMRVIYTFFEENILVVYFVYGLFFMLMGFSIALYLRFYKGMSNLISPKSFWYLAGFGILHAFAEWSIIFIPMHGQYVKQPFMQWLIVFQTLLFAVSLLLLLIFGANLLSEFNRKFRFIKVLPYGLFAIWLVSFSWLRISLKFEELPWLYTVSETYSRYFFALPGGLASSFALWLQYRRVKPVALPRVALNFLWSALWFFIYGIVAGLFAPQASFFPASIINEKLFFTTFGFPVQLIRGLCGMFMAIFLLRGMEVLETESRIRLERAEKRSTLLEERQRIARDLHDGIIQAIYGVGLNLENCTYLVDQHPEQTKQEIYKSMDNLNNVVGDLRSYIMNLKPLNYTNVDLEKGLNVLVDRFREECLINASLSIGWETTTRKVSGNVCGHILPTVQEILSNVTKHSKASSVKIALEYQRKQIKLEITDDGRGFDPAKVIGPESGHFGLQHIRERLELVSGQAELITNRGSGTTWILKFPYCDEGYDTLENTISG